MTNKRMETINKRTRIIRAILDGACLYQIAKDEGVTHSHINQIANNEKLDHCNHNYPQINCVNITPKS